MNRIEQELFDLEEHLRRNDDIADNSAYLTIIGIANKVSELDAENAKLRELVRIMHSELVSCEDNGYVCGGHKFDDRMRDLRIEADG